MYGTIPRCHNYSTSISFLPHRLKESGKLRSFKCMRKRARKGLPVIKVSARFRRRHDLHITSLKDLDILPSKKFPKQTHKRICIAAYTTVSNCRAMRIHWRHLYVEHFQVHEVVAYHRRRHELGEDDRLEAVLSFDGVTKEKTGAGFSLEVFSVAFEGCKTIYPLKVVCPEEAKAFKYEDEFRPIVQQFR